MTKKQIIISAGVLSGFMGLTIGLVFGFNLSKGTVVSAQINSEQISIPGNHTNEIIEKIKKELNDVAQYETAYGCLTFGENGQSEFCGDSKEKVAKLEGQLTEELHKLELSERTTDDLTLVKNNIENFAERKTDIIFSGTSANPYTNHIKRIEQWQDDQGFVYFINPDNNQVVQFGPGPECQVKFENKSTGIAPEELQKKATAYLARHIADFELVKESFTFRQMSKPGSVSYAFRWESPIKPKDEDVLPFVQVVLSPAGEVMSFNDIRSLYSN